MKGYCSNSPLRCSLAFDCEIINSEDNNCPKCLKALIVVDTKTEDIEKVKITIRQTIWLIIIILLIIIPCLFFSLIKCVVMIN